MWKTEIKKCFKLDRTINQERCRSRLNFLSSFVSLRYQEALQEQHPCQPCEILGNPMTMTGHDQRQGLPKQRLRWYSSVGNWLITRLFLNEHTEKNRLYMRRVHGPVLKPCKHSLPRSSRVPPFVNNWPPTLQRNCDAVNGGIHEAQITGSLCLFRREICWS